MRKLRLLVVLMLVLQLAVPVAISGSNDEWLECNAGRSGCTSSGHSKTMEGKTYYCCESNGKYFWKENEDCDYCGAGAPTTQPPPATTTVKTTTTVAQTTTTRRATTTVPQTTTTITCNDACVANGYASGTCKPFCQRGEVILRGFCPSGFCCCQRATTTTQVTTTTATTTTVTCPNPNGVCEFGYAENQQNCPDDCKTYVWLYPDTNLKPGEIVEVYVRFEDSRFNFTLGRPKTVSFDLILDGWYECFYSVLDFIV